MFTVLLGIILLGMAGILGLGGTNLLSRAFDGGSDSDPIGYTVLGSGLVLAALVVAGCALWFIGSLRQPTTWLATAVLTAVVSIALYTQLDTPSGRIVGTAFAGLAIYGLVTWLRGLRAS